MLIFHLETVQENITDKVTNHDKNSLIKKKFLEETTQFLEEDDKKTRKREKLFTQYDFHQRIL